MEKLVLFAILSVPILVVSWRSMSSVHNHGFYRFFGWEGILWLFLSNYKYWFIDPFSTRQLVSWVLLINGGYLVIAGIIEFMRKGKIDRSRQDEALFGFEKTTRLIDSGVYRHIRHPLYASLIYLTWGICFKNPTPFIIIISLVTSVFFYITSRYDEKECISYFGDEYREYMTRSKMFVPFIF